MKLELKHLSPYLPYGLKFYTEDLRPHVKPYSWEMTIKTDLSQIIANQNKPILRPLSDLTEEIDHGGKELIPFLEIKELVDEYALRHGKGREVLDNSANGWAICNHLMNSKKMYFPEKFFSYGSMIKLLEWHFDVFNLIPEELAIDINTIE